MASMAADHSEGIEVLRRRIAQLQSVESEVLNLETEKKKVKSDLAKKQEEFAANLNKVESQISELEGKLSELLSFKETLISNNESNTSLMKEKLESIEGKIKSLITTKEEIPVAPTVATPLSPPTPYFEPPECPVCFEECLPPKQIYQCPDGHIFCGTCSVQLVICPLCRTSLGEGRLSRVRYLEELLRNMPKKSPLLTALGHFDPANFGSSLRSQEVFPPLTQLPHPLPTLQHAPGGRSPEPGSQGSHSPVGGEGEISDRNFSGPGILIRGIQHPLGSDKVRGKYWGGFYVSYVNGTLHSEASGYGKFQFSRYQDIPAGTYLGTLRGGQCHGKGRVYYGNGYTVEGEWSEGKRNGWMVYSHPNGETNRRDLYNNGVFRERELWEASSNRFRMIERRSQSNSNAGTSE